MENAFTDLEWEEYEVRINGRKLNNLRFADDLVLPSENRDKLQTMVNEVIESFATVGLQINSGKTKHMCAPQKKV